MCSGRVDLDFVLRAFSRGADGVFIGGCWLGECHYVTEGNYDALSMMHLAKRVLEEVGINPDRLRLEWVSAAEGMRYAEVMNDFGRKLKELGPIGSSEGIDKDALKLKFAAVKKILPFLKLVERERLRVRFKTEEEYTKFFSSPEVDTLIREVIAENLAISQITTLLARNPLTTREISEVLRIEPAEVARCLNVSSRQGLIRYNESQKRYAIA
ncbi:tungsten-dependent benzoyl-CoA reductase-related protein bamF [Geobacter argillaceus]|uniref:Tungsten-dependent benzoyl-CoA reductase-related protein bamF n=2 Tax=Geobacter argillaceus TaxID=345631 RepID=A0A562VI33_9BACT|nr:tungsten-dependent benzoyl-CoA reductase-related protein bamF [Geobacter argillaceus]